MAIQPTQTDIVSTSNTTKTDLSLQVNRLLPAQAQVSSSLLATLLVNGQSLTTQVSLLQSQQLLQSQLVAVIAQQQLAVFKQGALATTSIILPPALYEQLQKELKQGYTSASKTVLGLLAQELGVDTLPVSTQIIKLTLTRKTLELDWLSQPPIVELKMLTGTVNQESTDTLTKLLQWLIPISLNDKATVIVQHDNQSSASQQAEVEIEFMMKFDLERLGRMHIQVALQQFDLVTKTWIDNPTLQKKFETTWPMLLERLEKLGFSCQSQVLPMSIEQQSDSQQAHVGLINIKV